MEKINTERNKGQQQHMGTCPEMDTEQTNMEVSALSTNPIKRTLYIILSKFYQQLKKKKIQVQLHVHTKTLKLNVYLTFNTFCKKKTHLYHKF